ncbi:MAG: DNA polymerase, partial [Deltaproteobacteria bacterium]|nr:DNA polymerase [Deltaproteobacteria bacterium]
KILNLLQQLHLHSLFEVWHLESLLTYITAGMEKRGVDLDVGKLKTFSEELENLIERENAYLADKIGKCINLNSPKQVENLLFNELKLPTSGIKKNKTGLSTDSDTLTYLAQFSEIPEIILRYRSFTKLLNGFVIPLLRLLSGQSTVYPTIRQIGTATGRIVYEKPNLQNVPVKDDLGKKIRECIIAPPGKILVRADYSQIELRVLAHLSSDPYLVKAFVEGKDIHKETAKLIFNLSDERYVTLSQRTIGKVVNFSILYGMSAYGLAKSLGVTPEVAKEILATFFRNLSGVDSYFEKVKKEADSKGFVKSILGRLRWVNSFKGIERERIIKNTPIQASASDIIKSSMVKLAKKFSNEGLDSTFIYLQIHDELLIVTEERQRDVVSEIVKHEMENAVSLIVPLKVEIGCGKNWSEAMS